MHIELDKISQPSIAAWLKKFKIKEVADLSRIKTTCVDDSKLENYTPHLLEYLFDYPVDKVWNTYLTAHPRQVWNGNMVSFGIMYSLKENKVLYKDDDFSRMEEGQIYLVNLKFYGGIYNLPVGQYVKNINPDKKEITLCYLEHGKSKGGQKIILESINRDKTKVTHLTHYKSNSAFRDKYLYPFFHKKTVDEYHHNILRIHGKSFSKINI